MANRSPFGSKRMHSGKVMLIILRSEFLRNVGNKLAIKQRHIKDNRKLHQNAFNIFQAKINIH